LVHLPDALGFGQGATMIQSYATAMHAFQRAGLKTGEKVLVLGAGGGIGLAAVDAAVAYGAHVIAAASTEEKLAAAVAAGASATIAYEEEDLKVRARELSGGGVDVVIDPVGGDKSEAALRALGRFGRLCVIGFTSGSIGVIPLNQVLLSNRTVLGIDWGAWAGSDPAGHRRLIEEAVAMASEGKLSPALPAERPLEDAAIVMADLLERRIVGKVVLVP
jgi:NADPH2:quinone reductase